VTLRCSCGCLRRGTRCREHSCRDPSRTCSANSDRRPTHQRHESISSPRWLAGVKRQADRLAIKFHHSRRAAGGVGERRLLQSLLAGPGSAAADREIAHTFRQKADIHVVVCLSRPRPLEVSVAVDEAHPSWGESARRKSAMIDFLVIHWGYVEEAIIRKIEGELKTRDDVALGRGNKAIFRVSIGPDLERYVTQRPDTEYLGIEDLVESECTAEQVVYLRRPSAIRRSASGEELAMIGKLLRHTQAQTTARYAHLADDPVKQAVTKISDRLTLPLLGPVDELSAKKANQSSISIDNEADDAAAA
jgi:hypothetical protein